MKWDFFYYDNTKVDNGIERLLESKSIKEILKDPKVILQAPRVNVSAAAQTSLTAEFGGELLGDGKYSVKFEYEGKASGSTVIATNIVSASAQLEGQFSYNDRATLFGSGEIPFRNVIVNWKAFGEIDHVLSGIGEAWGRLDLRSRSGDFSAFAELRHIRNTGGETFTQRNQISGLLGISAPIGGAGDFNPSWFGDVRMVATQGEIGLHWGHTLVMDSITFPDGSTPEEHGFQIVFDSGIPSPNLAVPEPSAYMLSVFAASILCIQRRPRRNGS